MEKLRLLSLFSGIGAFEKALINIGIDYDLVGFSEIDKYAMASYCSIHDVDEAKNLGDISKAHIGDIPDCDLVTYGFPCQDISLSGKLNGIDNKTRSGLLYEALRVINNKKPKYAVAENVRNLVSKRFKDDFDGLLEELDGLGYNSYWSILTAKDYGVPQNRQRVFIVSIRKDIDTGNFEFPKISKSELKIKDFLDTDIDERYYIEKERFGSLFIEVPEKDLINGIPQVAVREANKKGYAVATVGDSINVGYPNSKTRRGRVGKGVVQTLETVCLQATLEEDGRLRKFTPREYWRLMGFTDEDYNKAYKSLTEAYYRGKENPDRQLYKQAGNSIVVTVLEGIFKQMFDLD